MQWKSKNAKIRKSSIVDFSLKLTFYTPWWRVTNRKLFNMWLPQRALKLWLKFSQLWLAARLRLQVIMLLVPKIELLQHRMIPLICSHLLSFGFRHLSFLNFYHVLWNLYRDISIESWFCSEKDAKDRLKLSLLCDLQFEFEIWPSAAENFRGLDQSDYCRVFQVVSEKEHADKVRLGRNVGKWDFDLILGSD